MHDCEFCEVESPIEVHGRSGRRFLGSGEIHVRSADGVIYAAPSLVIHYISAHNYRPPAQFVEAVLRAAES